MYIDCIHGLQEELKILRLRYSLLVEEEMETREKELNRLMEHKKAMKVFIERLCPTDDLLLIALCYAWWHVPNHPNKSICQLFQLEGFSQKQIDGVLNVKLFVNDSNHAKSYKIKTNTIFVKFTNKFTETS